MHVSKVSVTLCRSIKMAEYKYYKPAVTVEVAISESDNLDTAKDRALYEAETFINEIVMDEKKKYNAAVEKAHLEGMLNKYSEDDTEYQLALEKLRELGGVHE